ncbi:MAG TPA: TonB-dependent receptor [Polyangiaceae bacterium]|nr:TonB-dependent receptor [Polyangiaceae bacterium]
MRARAFVSCASFALAALLGARSARADLIEARPTSAIVPNFPVDAPALEVQVVLSLVIDEAGHVESALVETRVPADAPASFDAAALAAVRDVRFEPSRRDGNAIRSRIDYIVVFHPPQTAAPPVPPAPVASAKVTSGPPSAPQPNSQAKQAAPSAAPPADRDEQDEDYALTIEVRGQSWASPRGVGDIRIKRELLDAAPHQQTSEMLSAAPGFFVDHEDGEGLGNDVFLRGFELDHGSGIEMRVGNVPINSPVHVQGQGYADANFIIPEVVRSIRVLEGPYDPRQGDTAIVGSAYFDLGVSERANELKASYGSFNQARVIGVAAPAGFDEQTFAAFAVRKSDGFGSHRASESGTMNAQYGLDLGADSHLRLLATAYGARSQFPGVLRQSDIDSGAVGFYGRYPFYTDNQGVEASRVIVSADFDTVTEGGAHFELAPWAMWTNFDARENFTGNIYSSALDPMLAAGQGDLWETVNRESAVGAVSRLHSAPVKLTSFLEANVEPGVSVRVGHTDQTKSLLNPETLAVWDRRLDAGLDTLDAAAYLDLGLRLFRRARLSGGVRADLLNVTMNDRLGYDVPQGAASSGAFPGSNRTAQGVAVSPRVTAEYDLAAELTAVVSYGEGFRSLEATANVATSAGISGEGPSIQEGGKPYSKVRSYEAGLRAKTRGESFSATVSAFETHVENELVFEASSGSFTTEGASVRRGVVGSAVVKPFSWLLASLAGSVSSATFTTLAPGVSHFVPNIPPLLLRADVSAHGPVARVRGEPLGARIGFGYTFLAGRHLTDTIIGPADHVLNGHAALRFRNVELGVEGFNLLALKYADDREYYISNWSTRPGTPLATPATHISAAPPLTLLGTLALFF